MAYAYKKIRIGSQLRDRHRLVMEARLGRRLGYNEIVHHLDGDSRNDDPGNLAVVGRGYHNTIHARMRMQ